MNQTIPAPSHPHLQNLTRRSASAMAGVLVSRASGVIRTLVVNATFGANFTLDAFNVAFRFPNGLRDLFADGALSSAFIKALVDVAPAGIHAERELISIVTGFFTCITLLLALIGVYYATPFMHLISDPKFQLTGGVALAAQLFQLLIFYLPFTMLNAVVMGVLGTHGYTFRAMNGSIFLSVGMITGALVLAPLFAHFNFVAINGLAWGAMIGVVLQLFYQAAPLKKLALFTLPCFNPLRWWRYQPLHNILIMMLPRALGQGALIIALIINTFFALRIGPGALTYVATTIIIIQVPIGMFGVATGFAALPAMARALNEKNALQFAQLVGESLRITQWLALTTMLGFALLIVPFYVLVFQHGKITYHDSVQNCIAICAYSSGIFFAAGGKILQNALYAINATRQIVINAIIYLIVNASMSAILTAHFGLIGLGLSFGLASAGDFWLNYYVVNRRIKRHYQMSAYAIPHFTLKNIFNSLLAFGISVIGIMLIEFIWLKQTHLTWTSALLITGIGGILFLAVFLFCVWRWGPATLQKLI